jgi:hypothetical protein
MLYAFIWVIPRRLNFICRRFGTFCLFHLHRPACEDGTECSEISAYRIQTPGNYTKENIQHSEHCENLKSRSQLMLLQKRLDWIYVLGKALVFYLCQYRSCKIPLDLPQELRNSPHIVTETTKFDVCCLRSYRFVLPITVSKHSN